MRVGENSKIAIKSTLLENAIQSYIDTLVKIKVEFRNSEILVGYCQGERNPADVMTRPASYKRFKKSNYFTGPDLQNCSGEVGMDTGLSFVVPNPISRQNESGVTDVETSAFGVTTSQEDSVIQKGWIPIERFSSLKRLTKTMQLVFGFIRKLWQGVVKRKNWDRECIVKEDHSYALKKVIQSAQREHFTDIVRYFDSKKAQIDMPNLVGQLNIYMGGDSLLRVRGKSV